MQTLLVASRKGMFVVCGQGAQWAVVGHHFAGDPVTQVLADPALSHEVGWLALGVGLTVAGGSQGALLNGLRCPADKDHEQRNQGNGEDQGQAAEWVEPKDENSEQGSDQNRENQLRQELGKIRIKCI